MLLLQWTKCVLATGLKLWCHHNQGMIINNFPPQFVNQLFQYLVPSNKCLSRERSFSVWGVHRVLIHRGIVDFSFLGFCTGWYIIARVNSLVLQKRWFGSWGVDKNLSQASMVELFLQFCLRCLDQGIDVSWDWMDFYRLALRFILSLVVELNPNIQRRHDGEALLLLLLSLLFLLQQMAVVVTNGRRMGMKGRCCCGGVAARCCCWEGGFSTKAGTH